MWRENWYPGYVYWVFFIIKNEFKPPDYEVSRISSCDSCSTYPIAAGENQINELEVMLKEILDTINK